MRSFRWQIVVVVAAAATFGARPAQAFRACTAASVSAGHWPDPRNTNLFGTQKWEFDWQVSNEGLEIYNVKYTADLNQPRKPVLVRASVPMLPVHYPDNAPTCGGSPHGWSDLVAVLDSGNSTCCQHVPITISSLPDRAMACNPRSGAVDTSTCPANSEICDGICTGTQVDMTAPIEDEVGETVSGAADADVLLSTTFRNGGYQFIQRWRFRDDGTILPSFRLGGVHDCQFHNHQIYWRFDFGFVDSGQSEVVQQCNGGGCVDIGNTGWSSNLACTCGLRTTATTSWRVQDQGVANRGVVVESAVTEGDANNFCDGANTECLSPNAPGGPQPCVNTHDFCALPAVNETFYANNCNDKLDPIANPSAQCSGFSSGTDSAFWYFGHVDHHDPCSFLPMTDPKPGTVAFGPTLRLVGSW